MVGISGATASRLPVLMPSARTVPAWICGNAVIGVRYGANEIGPGVSEVIAYGTAVRVEAADTNADDPSRRPTLPTVY